MNSMHKFDMTNLEWIYGFNIDNTVYLWRLFPIFQSVWIMMIKALLVLFPVLIFN